VTRGASHAIQGRRLQVRPWQTRVEGIAELNETPLMLSPSFRSTAPRLARQMPTQFGQSRATVGLDGASPETDRMPERKREEGGPSQRCQRSQNDHGERPHRKPSGVPSRNRSWSVNRGVRFRGLRLRFDRHCAHDMHRCRNTRHPHFQRYISYRPPV
jgi:hypothetical protein